METKSFNLYRYSIPVDSQLILRGHFLKRREGLIVRVACSRDGWGDSWRFATCTTPIRQPFNSLLLRLFDSFFAKPR